MQPRADQDRQRRANQDGEGRAHPRHAEPEHLRRVRHFPGVGAASGDEQQAQAMENRRLNPSQLLHRQQQREGHIFGEVGMDAHAPLQLRHTARTKACLAPHRSRMTRSDRTTNSGAWTAASWGPREAFLLPFNEGVNVAGIRRRSILLPFPPGSNRETV